jgi:hypothetical protein
VPVTAHVLDFELAVAARRPRRLIGEACVRDGLVVVNLPARLTPDQADAWADHLRMLAQAARDGAE